MKKWKVYLAPDSNHYAIISADTRGKAKWNFAKIYGYKHSFCKIRAVRFH